MRLFFFIIIIWKETALILQMSKTEGWIWTLSCAAIEKAGAVQNTAGWFPRYNSYKSSQIQIALPQVVMQGTSTNEAENN